MKQLGKFVTDRNVWTYFLGEHKLYYPRRILMRVQLKPASKVKISSQLK